MLSVPDLPARILYTWADLYSQQLRSGQDYGQLRATYAIWILAQDLLRGDPAYAHRYRLCDEQGRRLIDHGGIWLMEPNKFAGEPVETEEQRWLKFFTEGERLDEANLPDWMQTAEMMQAMSTLKAFSENERAYHTYQARQNFLRQQRSIQRVIEDERAAKEAALRERETERQAKEAAQAEVERLKALLGDKMPPADS